MISVDVKSYGLGKILTKECSRMNVMILGGVVHSVPRELQHFKIILFWSTYALVGNSILE